MPLLKHEYPEEVSDSSQKHGFKKGKLTILSILKNYVQLLDTLKAALGFSKVDLRNSGLGNVWEISDHFTAQHPVSLFFTLQFF